MNSLQDSIEYGLCKLGYDKIKDNQRKVLEAYVADRDVLMVAPTGSGMSLIFQIAPFVFDFISYGVRESIGSVCLIIASSLSLMRDQAKIKITPGLLIPFPAKIVNLIRNCASEPSPSLPRAPLRGTLACGAIIAVSILSVLFAL